MGVYVQYGGSASHLIEKCCIFTVYKRLLPPNAILTPGMLLQTNTKGTIYILSLIIKNSNLSSKMTLFFFKVFSFMVYTLLHAFEPCVRAFFPFRLRHLQNIVLSNYVGSNKNKSCSRLNVHAIFYICWWN